MSLMKLDKSYHFGVGFATVLVTTAVFWLLTGGHILYALLGSFTGWHIARCLAYVKEGYDEARPDKHTSDILDAEITIAGASAGLATMTSVTVLLFAAGQKGWL